MDTATSKALGMDTATTESPGVDIVTTRRGYSDASFLLHRILHQKVRNMENLRGKIRAFVLVIISAENINQFGRKTKIVRLKVF